MGLERSWRKELTDPPCSQRPRRGAPHRDCGRPRGSARHGAARCTSLGSVRTGLTSLCDHPELAMNPN